MVRILPTTQVDLSYLALMEDEIISDMKENLIKEFKPSIKTISISKGRFGTKLGYQYDMQT